MCSIKGPILQEVPDQSILHLYHHRGSKHLLIGMCVCSLTQINSTKLNVIVARITIRSGHQNNGCPVRAFHFIFTAGEVGNTDLFFQGPLSRWTHDLMTLKAASICPVHIYQNTLSILRDVLASCCNYYLEQTENTFYVISCWCMYLNILNCRYFVVFINLLFNDGIYISHLNA